MQRLDPDHLDPQQQRSLERRPRVTNALAGGRAESLIEIELPLGEQHPVVLEMKPLPRPLAPRALELFAPALGLARLEPGCRRQGSPERGGSVAVAAFVGFAQLRRHAPAQLVELAEIIERQNRIQPRGMQLPRDTGALVKQVGRPIATEM